MGLRLSINLFTVILIAGIVSCDTKSGKTPARLADNSKPEDNRFIPVVLTPQGSLDEPMMF